MADLPGWPFLSPTKIQMQKCDKCSEEFYSTINYRRHMRLHRRNLNIEKDSPTKNRGLLQSFWDKLSVEESMDIMSFEDVSLEGVTGSSILKELTSLILKPRCTSLPPSYVKAGVALLDIVQARPCRFPISSSELFNILDEASEKTFLCAGTAGSLQKYVFDGDAGKIGLDMRNLVACTSFLIEQKLVKGCLADKDAEALRYQKLLVEEEEAAQRRQAALLEKKRLKKRRQKEQRAKELVDPPEDSLTTLPIPCSTDAANSNPEMSEIQNGLTSSSELVQIVNLENLEEDHEGRYPDFSTYQDFEHGAFYRRHRSGRRRVWQATRIMQRSENSFHSYHNHQAAKPGPTQKLVPYRDFHIANVANGSKVWAPKAKSETDEESQRIWSQSQVENLPSEDRNCEVLIGSISVSLGNCQSQQKDENCSKVSEGCALEFPVPVEDAIHNKPDQIQPVQSIAKRLTVKQWRPVSQHENGGRLATVNWSEASEVGAFPRSDNREVGAFLAMTIVNSSWNV